MKVKWIIKSDKKLSVFLDDKEFNIDYKSDDQKIFEEINKKIINNLIKEEMSFEIETIENQSIQYKVGKSIINTYLAEINKIRKILKYNVIEIIENAI